MDRNDAVFVHFYRAVVGHMDVWRQRMDATTKWAAATAAGVITFTFSTVTAPHPEAEPHHDRAGAGGA
jgi:uncharacterized membrane protein